MLPDDTDPCPGIPEGPGGLPGAVVGGFEDIRCWRALESRLASTPGFFQRSFTGIQPVAVRRTRAEIPVDPVNPGPKPWPIRTGIVVVGVAIGPSIPGHPVDGAATAEEVRAAFRGGTILPNATLAGLQSWELGPTGGGYSTEVLGYGLAVAYARSIHDAAKVSPDPIFLDALGFVTGKHILDGAKETVVVGSHGSLRVPNGWAPLQYVGGGGGTPLTDWPSATPLVAVTEVRDTTCEAKATFDHLKNVAKTVPTPDYKKLGVFPVEDPRWNQGTQLSSRPELASYEAAKTSITSPDAVVRATAFGYRPVSSALRGVLTNGYVSGPLPPKVAILHGPANQYALHGSVWDYEPPPDAVLAIADPDKLCEPDGEKSCSCTPQRPWFTLGALVKAPGVNPSVWPAEIYLGRPVPEGLFPALHKYAVPGTPAYRAATDVLKKGDSWKRPFTPLNVPMPADGSFRYPSRQGYLPRELFSPGSGNEAAAGVYFQTPFGASDAWTLATGTHAEVLSRVLGYERWLAETWIVPDAAGRSIIAIRHAGYGGGLSGWDKGKGAWVQSSPYLAPGSSDYAEYDFPFAAVGPNIAFPGGKWPGDSIVSEHLTASEWYPGATRWLTNYGNEAEFNQKQRAAPTPPTGSAKDVAKGVTPNANNVMVTHWAPSTAQDATRTYDARIKACGVDEYVPGIAEKHWPVALEKGSFAGLWGHSRGKDQASEEELPTASFASDMIGITQRFHEGLDINWTFRRKFIDPAYRGVLTGTPQESCFGTYKVGLDFASFGDIDIVIPCSETLLGDCTSEQLFSPEGCSPTDRLFNRVSSACSFSNTGSCSGFFGCVGRFFYDLGKCALGSVYSGGRYAVSTILPLNLIPDTIWNLDELEFKKRPFDPAQDALFVEIEHRLATAGKTDGSNLCPGFECLLTDFDASNGLTFLNQFGIPQTGVFETTGEGTEQFVISSSFDRKHNGLQADLGTPFLFPYSRFPGFASQRAAIWGATVDRKGNLSTSEIDAVRNRAARLLPEPARANLIAGSTYADTALKQHAFRTELVGDMILDCGHPPVHAEIHPFRAGIVHATPPPQYFQGAPRVTRYSLFSWLRERDNGETIAFEVWPPPRPRGATKIRHKFLFPDQTQEASGIICVPWPAKTPNRLRCDIGGSGLVAGNDDVCEDNERMNPSCARAVSGGLLEVDWE